MISALIALALIVVVFVVGLNVTIELLVRRTDNEATRREVYRSVRRILTGRNPRG